MFRRSLLALALVAVAAPSEAQLARTFSSATYTGVGGSQLKSDIDNLGKAVNLDAIGGYNLTPELPWGRIAAELNLGVTVSPGKNKGQPAGGGVIGGGGGDTTGNNTASNEDLQSFIFALQGVYRSPGRLYGIGAAGYSLVNTNIQEIQDKGSGGFSFGGGAGFKFGANTAAVEVMYQRVSKELQTIGIRFVY